MGNKARMIEAAAVAVTCNLTQEEEIKAASDQSIKTFGRLDCAFNAGIEQTTAPSADIPLAEWDRIAAVNLGGVFLCRKCEVPLMPNQGGGAIVNTSSGAGVKGFSGGAAYGASIFGVVGLTNSPSTK